MMISIIIVTYNSGKYIRRCLDSVISQDLQDWECILVDGASTDDTVNVFDEFEKRDSRFKHISEPDSGIYDAMNKGWKIAKGDWIYYLGSDDMLLPQGLSDLCNLAGNLEDWDVVYGHIQYLKADGTIHVHKHHSHKQLPWKIFASHQGLIMRRTIIEKLDGFDMNLKIIADKDLIIRSYFLNPPCRYRATEAVVAQFAGGGASSRYWECFKEDI